MRQKKKSIRATQDMNRIMINEEDFLWFSKALKARSKSRLQFYRPSGTLTKQLPARGLRHYFSEPKRELEKIE